MHFLLLLWIGVGNPFKDPTTEATKPYLSNSRPAIPVAIITYSTINGGNTIADGETVVFDGTSSYDPDGGSITKYRWRINGSLQGTASTFSWTFDIADGSSQSVKLSIWDDENEYREVTETVSVIAGGNQDPVASFTPAGSTVDDDDTVNFTSTSTDSDGTISTTEWFFNALGGTADGTGTTFNWTFDIASGSSQTIYLVVTDNESAKDTTSEVFTVQEAGTQTITRHYYLKDHLGSTRATVDDSGEVVHYADYYPFGMLLPGRSLISSNDEPKELYTGHEHDDETGLYYAGARYYDPIVARWGGVDPLADEFPAWSPYHYVFGNPISLTDPDGQMPDCPACFARGLARGFSSSTGQIVESYTSRLKTAEGRISILEDIAPISIAPSDDRTFIEEIEDLTAAVSSSVNDAVRTVRTGDSEEIGFLVGSVTVVVAAAVTVNKGRGKNRLRRNDSAIGDHSSYGRDNNGNIFKYETYNAGRSEKRFDGGKPDGSDGRPHINKKTRKQVPTPHVTGRNIEGGVRHPVPEEIPNNDRFKKQ